MYAYLFVALCCITSLSGCSSISDMRSKEEKSYTPLFLKKVGKVKEFYRKGHYRTALLELKKVQNVEGASPIEQAYAKNLMGIIFFSMGDLKRSESSFLAALAKYNYRSFLRTRIYLNLGSLYYKRGFYGKSYEYLIRLDSTLLEKRDREQFYELGRIVGEELGQKMLKVVSLVGIVGESGSIDEIKSHALFENLRTSYLELSDREKANVFEKGREDSLVLVGYLSYLDANRRYYEGDRERAVDILDWLKGFYRKGEPISTLIEDFFHAH